MAAFAVSTMFSFTSCSDDEGNEDLNPTISLIGTDGNIANDVTVEVGETLNFSLVASESADSKKNLEKLEIIRVANNDVVTILDSTFNEKSIAYEFSVNAQNQAGTENFSFTVTDKDGESDEVTIVVTTATAYQELPGFIYNVNGTQNGAFSLATGTSDSSTGDDDIQSVETAGNPFTGSFTSETGITFKKWDGQSLLIGFSYENANSFNTEAEWNTLGTASSDVNNPVDGDVYLFNMNGSFGALKIVSNDDSNTEGGTANPGKLSFTYKK